MGLWRDRLCMSAGEAVRKGLWRCRGGAGDMDSFMVVDAVLTLARPAYNAVEVSWITRRKLSVRTCCEPCRERGGGGSVEGMLIALPAGAGTFMRFLSAVEGLSAVR